MLFPPTIKTLNMQFSNYCFFSSLSFQELFPNFFLKNTFKIVFFAAFLFRSFFQTFFLKNTFQIVFLQPFFSGAFSRLFFKKKYFPNCFFCSLSFQEQEQRLVASLSALKPQPAKKWNLPPLAIKVLIIIITSRPVKKLQKKNCFLSTLPLLRHIKFFQRHGHMPHIATSVYVYSSSLLS